MECFLIRSGRGIREVVADTEDFEIILGEEFGVLQLHSDKVKSSLFYQTLKVRRKESVKRPCGHLSPLHL